MFRIPFAGVAMAALLGAGCASAPPATVASVDAHFAPVVDAPAYDVRSKFEVPRPKRGAKVNRAEVNAEYQRDTEVDEHGRPPSAAQIFRAHAQRRAIERDVRGTASLEKAAGINPSQWTPLGPSNVGGRVRALAFDPSTPRRVLAGTASGGLWASPDMGGSWQLNSDFLPNLSITTIVFDPNRRGVVFIGTGEESQLIVGAGVFRSIDNGATWQPLAATNPDSNPDWRFVNRLAMHPSLPNVLLAGVTHDDGIKGAIYRSTDGGESWARVSGMKALDIAFDPGNPQNLVAGLDDGFMAYSRDAGASWLRTTEALVPTPAGRGGSRGPSARVEIAFARTQPGLVYASVDNEKGEVWRSPDGGETWTKLATLGHLRSQGWYDNAIWVDPTDALHVITGGLDLHQSLDGGVSFRRISDADRAPVSPHADHHAIVSPPDYGPGNRVILNGNDGGIYRASDALAVQSGGSGWINANNGLAATQFYSGAGRTAAGGRVIGGTQDNGSLQLGTSWRQWFGGDGGYVAVDPFNDQRIFGSTQFLGVVRSDLGGGSARFICTGITEAWKAEENFSPCGPNTTGDTNFIAPLILDPSNPNRMLAGAASLWVSDNVRALAPTWRTIKGRAAGNQNYINAIAAHERDGNIIWVGHNAGEIFRTTNGLEAAPLWTRMGAGTLPLRRVNRILIDPEDASHVLVALTGFSPHNLWETRDGGSSWRSITGNLPAAPVFDIKRHPRNPAWLYAATSVGLFTSENGGATWSTTNEGPANVRIRELFWLDDATLGVATYGRGMFKVSLGTAAHANYQDLWWSGPAENGWGMSITQHAGMIFAALFVYDAQGKPVWYVIPGGSWNAANTAFTGSVYFPAGSWFASYDVGRFNVGAPVGTATITFTARDSATLSYTINGVSGTKAISRQLFGPVDATPTAPYGDLWWGGLSQNGWGVAINQQYRKLFSVWYTYDAQGRNTWYVVPDGTWSATNVYTGTAYRTGGSAWLGAAYNPAAFGSQAVGQVTFMFTDPGNGTMSYTIDGVSGSKPITRQPF